MRLFRHLAVFGLPLILISWAFAAEAPKAVKPAVAAPATAPAAVPAAKPQTSSVSGTVTGPDGKPLPGAVVRAVSVPKESATRFRGDRPLPPAPLTAKTDAAGAFKIEGLPKGAIAVRVEAPGLAPAGAEDVPAGATLNLKMKPGLPVYGRVLDLTTQKPVAGATVRGLEHTAAPFGREAAHATATAEDGTFKIADCAPGLVDLEATAPGKTLQRLENIPARAVKKDEAPDPSAHTLFLQPGGRLAGRVLGSDGKPVADASVTARASDGKLLEMMRDMRGAERTDASGRYAFEGLPAGSRYTLRARKAGAADGEAGPIAVEAGTDRSDLDLKLETGATLTFQLLSADDVPAKATDVRLQPSGERRGRGAGRIGFGSVDDDQISSGPEGRFTVRNLEAGSFDVTLSPEDYADVVKEGVRLRGGETVDLGTLRVKESKSLSGRIADKNGQPVANAAIGAFWFDAGAMHSRETKSRADGSYRLTGLSDQPLQDLWAAAEGYATGRREGAVPGDTALDFTLDKLGSVVGRVLLPGGAPPASFRVTAHPEAKAGNERNGFRMVVGTRGEEPDGVFADPSGNFRLDNIAPGATTIEARADGYAPARKSGLDVRSDEAAEAGTLTLSTGRALRGRVIAAKDDAPIPGATVSLSRAQGFGMRFGGNEADAVAISAADGSFAIEGLEARTYAVATGQPDYSPNNGQVEIPAEKDVDDFVVKLSRGGILTGTVRDAQKQPVPGAQVLIAKIPMGGGPQTATTGPDGKYVVEKISPGDYIVMRQSSGPVMLMSGMKQATVREGETTVFDLDEASKIMLTGRVLKGSQPVPNVMLFFSPGSGGEGVDMTTARSDADGRYQVGLDKAGTYSVGVASAGFMGGGVSGLHIEVPDQPNPVVDIPMKASGIAGKVTDANGKGLSGASVTARATGEAAATAGGRGERMDAMTTSDGSYAIDNLAPGTYAVAVRASGYRAPDERSVTLANDDDRASADFRLEPGRSLHGHVLDRQGNGIAGAVVIAAPSGSVVSAGRDALPARTDVNGAFVLTAPGDGALDFAAIAPGFPVARASGLTPEDGDDVRLESPRGARVRVTVVGADGKPVPGASIRCSAKPAFLGSDYASFMNATPATGPDGAASVGPLAPGSYEVSIASGSKKASQSINVTDGGDAVLSVALP